MAWAQKEILAFKDRGGSLRVVHQRSHLSLGKGVHDDYRRQLRAADVEAERARLEGERRLNISGFHPGASSTEVFQEDGWMLGGKLAVGIRAVQNLGWLAQWRWGRGGLAALSTAGELPVEGTFMRDENVALEIMDWPKGRKWEAVKIFSSKQLRGTLATAMDRSRWDRVCSGACIVCKWGVPATACMQAVEFFHREEGGGSCNAGIWRQAVLEEITEEGYVVSSG